jgi:hypothetical protein
MQRLMKTARHRLRWSVRVSSEEQNLSMRRHRVANDHIADYAGRREDRPAAAGPLDLPGLAYECESLVIRDPLLPQALIQALLDVAIALREEAGRRRRG